MIVFSFLGLIFLLLGFFLFLIPKFLGNQNQLVLEKTRKKNPNIGIFIPARDESKVISGLLKSIENQTVSIPPENIYVIVEKKSDPTVQIVKAHHASVFIRKKLDLKTKGYALQEIIEHLCKQKKYYDCYFIFDADNILEPNFIELMLKDYQKGYAISTGYRNLKNKDSYFSLSAGLTFLMINEIRNRFSLQNHGNIILSGTGYYIHGDYIKKWGTFPFHSLTEDYESSLYYTLQGMSTHYQEEAIFYDEQPENYRVSLNQRSRWIKGYFTNWFSYLPKLHQKRHENPVNKGSLLEMEIGILPVICIVLGIIFFIVYFFVSSHSFMYLFAFLLVLYFILILITGILLNLMKEKTSISKKIYFQVLFYHPIFLLSYIHAFLIAVFKKNLGWTKIEHTKNFP